MKHWLIYLVFTAGVIVLGALPFENHDVGELRPVETILVTRQNGQVHIQTDTGDQGTAATGQPRWRTCVITRRAVCLQPPAVSFYWGNPVKIWRRNWRNTGS